MVIFIMMMIILFLGAFLFLFSAGFLAYYLIKSKKGFVKFIVLLVVSILMMVAPLIMVVSQIVEKEQQKKETSDEEIIDTYYTLSDEQMEILEKDFEDCTSEEIEKIIPAISYHFDEDESYYEERLREFFIKYYESSGMDADWAKETFDNAREAIKSAREYKK